MSQATTNQSEATILAAQALIQKIQSEHQSLHEFYTAEGFNPEKTGQLLEQALNEQAKAQIQTQLDTDLRDVEQEVAEESARLAFAQSPAPLTSHFNINHIA
ncbi:hypothetical protein [Alcaligenes endophyticus]|uniref:Uncharacterized protein n=1 Tax=Alcaligenes endophyticus TaxID=1929088 RepID=A0ABT8EFN6_9BURK|nr:hypothetical protein [Alcaligenes endophyticus]MCX5590266.1 hypothetical protein [Alcaligenes endophyticus]MDN4120070.1 hypothetical protein [Alcaligenes endophyticus]